MESALRNPLILSNIFRYLDFESLKATRSVCGLWADEAAPFLGIKSVLKVHKLFPQCCAIAPPPFHFDPKMAINVDINFNCGGIVTGNYSHSAKKEGRAAAANISSFLSTCHKNIESIKVTNNYTFPVFESLAKLEFPKLKNFLIEGSDFCVKNYAPKLYADLPYCVSKAMKSIEFKLPREFGKTMSDLYEIIQDLIDCSENLEVLKIEEFYVPNLDECNKLKVLEYTGFPEGALQHRGPCVQNGSFDVEPFHEMLEGVKDSLEVLTIACRHDLFCRQVEAELEDFQTPVMNKLEKLCINGFAIVGFQTNLSKKKFPMLKMLAISSEYKDAEDMFEAPFPCEVSKDGVKVFNYDVHES